MSSSSSGSVTPQYVPCTASDSIDGTTTGDHTDNADATLDGPPGPNDAAATAPRCNTSLSSDDGDAVAPEDSGAVSMGPDEVQEEAGTSGPSVASPGIATPGRGWPRGGISVEGGRRAGAPRRRRSDPGGSFDRLWGWEEEEVRIDLDGHAFVPRPTTSEEEGTRRKVIERPSFGGCRSG